MTAGRLLNRAYRRGPRRPFLPRPVLREREGVRVTNVSWLKTLTLTLSRSTGRGDSDSRVGGAPLRRGSAAHAFYAFPPPLSRLLQAGPAPDHLVVGADVPRHARRAAAA